METRSLTQPLLRSIANSPLSRPLTQRPSPTLPHQRQQSTASRTKRALRLPPHPSFLASSSEAPQVIYNPPSSTASVYHTPFKFLPRSDPRRSSNLSQLLHPPAPQGANLPPAVKARPKKYTVTREQVAEMRELRAQDPARWSVLKLAERYDCAPLFVMACCKASAEHWARERARLDAVKARWGPVRASAREERKKRRELLMKDAL
ncbi:mitochondrial ribosomal protein subunit L20-domain-containing protein [Jackrogersella minutella]|nr:mitochondrial ribosomal protein subunit L20-domain-containing protein [Jackrogersella minutella]